MRLPLGLIASLLLVDLADEWFTFLPAGAIASIRADLGLSYGQAGLLLALLPAGGFLGVVLMAAADFVSRRLLGAGGAFVFALCLLAFATGRSFATLAVASFLWGAASDAFVHVTWLSVQPLPLPRRDGSTPWSVARAVVRDARVLRLAALWGLSAALEAPFLGFLIANLQETRGISAAAATALMVSIVAGGMATYAVLVLVRRPSSTRARFVGSSLGLLTTTVVTVAAPWTVVVGLAGVAFGAATALLWVALQAAVFRLRPGAVWTTQAVVSGLSTLSVAVPPLIGVAADHVGLGTAVWLFALAPAAIVLLVLTSRESERSRA